MSTEDTNTNGEASSQDSAVVAKLVKSKAPTRKTQQRMMLLLQLILRRKQNVRNIPLQSE